MSDKQQQLATFRLPLKLWEAFKAQARRNGLTASEVLTNYVQDYVGGVGPSSQPELENLDNLDARIDEKITPIREELAELRAALGKW